ncbi:hypothetical protein [Catenulispora subtropica]|uniref:Uncharacterized protein n=1 Tax=Catenulispora subtropica TaxID=450798 RepID=A0ABN2RQI5_9ACTN
MSKVTPSALRGLSVAAGTVGLAAVGAAVAAAPAGAAVPGLSGLGGGGLPLSTNALSAVKGLLSHNPGQIAGVPIAGLPGLSQLSDAMDAAGPGVQAIPGLSSLGFGAPSAETRSRKVDDDHQSAAHAASAAKAAQTAATMPVPAAPGAPAAPAAPGAVPPPAATPQPAASPPAAKGPLSNVTDALPVKSLPVIGGLAGGLPLLGGGGGLGGLPLG